MKRLGLLGCGRIGRVHARAISQLPGAELAAVSDAQPDAAARLASEHDAEVRRSEEIVSASDIDAIVICTPTDTHADLIEAAARAGKPSFCEKPIDLDVERVRTCLETVKAQDSILMIGFQRRFDPHFRALKSSIEAGTIGTLEQIIITSRDPGPPPIDYVRRSGGLFRDMTIHDFDMARFLLEEPVRRVLAIGDVRVMPEIADVSDVDTATVLMHSESGVQVTITNSRRATYGYDQRVEVLGSKGMLQVGNVPAYQLPVATETGIRSSVLTDFFMDRYRDAYAEEMRCFVEIVETGAPPPVSGQDGLEALVLADAATTSARNGAWVMT